jgi:hypothetical protein
MRITIPAYNANATPVTGRNPTIVYVEATNQNRVIRVTGTGKVHLTFDDYPGNAAPDGLPLGASADADELGELYVITGSTDVWISAPAETEICVAKHL